MVGKLAYIGKLMIHVVEDELVSFSQIKSKLICNAIINAASSFRPRRNSTKLRRRCVSTKINSFSAIAATAATVPTMFELVSNFVCYKHYSVHYELNILASSLCVSVDVCVCVCVLLQSVCMCETVLFRMPHSHPHTHKNN